MIMSAFRYECRHRRDAGLANDRASTTTKPVASVAQYPSGKTGSARSHMPSPAVVPASRRLPIEIGSGLLLGHLASLPQFLKWRRGNVPCNSNISSRSDRSCNSGIATGPIPGPIVAFPVGPLLTTRRVSAGCPGARLSPVLRAALARYPTRNCRCDPCVVSLRCFAPASGRRPLCAAPPYRRATAPRHSSFQSSGAARPRDARTRRGCPPLRCGAGGFAPQTPDAAWARLRPPLRTINRLVPIDRASVGATGRLALPGADGPP